ncbi:unnamed protein product [Sphagnum tenellum]
MTFGVTLAQISPAFASSAPQFFTYQGRFYNSGGTTPLAEVVDLILDIYDPDGYCLLYEEEQKNIDLTGTAGLFSIQIGSQLTDPKRTTSDPGLSMSIVFANTGNQILSSSRNCTAGYTPQANDVRNLRVTVIPHSSEIPTTLYPDQIIGTQTGALVAQTIQGVDLSGIIQSASNVSGQGNVNLSNLIKLTNSSDASALHNHDSRYSLLSTPGSPASLGTGITYTDGMIGIDTSSPNHDIGLGGDTSRTVGVERSSNSNGNNLTLSAGGAEDGGSNLNGGNLILSSGISTGDGGSSIEFKISGSGSLGNTDNTAMTQMILSSNGFLGIGTTSPLAELHVVPLSSSVIGEIIQANPSQTANLLEIRNSSGTPLAWFDSSGVLNGVISGSVSAASSIVVSPTSTNATYYPTLVPAQSSLSANVGTSNNLNFNPSTGTLSAVNLEAANGAFSGILSATSFSGALSGTNVTLSGSLSSVSSISTAGSLSAGITNLGSTTVTSISVSNGATLNGGLTVSNGGNLTLIGGGSLSVSGTSNLGSTTLGSLSVTGGSSLGTTTVSSLSVSASGATTLGGLLSVAGVTTLGTLSADSTQLGSTTAGSLSVTGAALLGSLSVTGAVSLGSTTFTAGGATLNGTILSNPVSQGSTTTIDFARGNMQATSLPCQAFTLNNVVNGGSYMLAIQNTTSGTCSFAASGFTVKMPPGHGATTAGNETLYSFSALGTTLYVSWVPGY